MAPILAPILGVYLFQGHIFLKIGHIAPFLATIQRLSKTRAFLLEKRSKVSFVWAAPSLSLARTYLIIALNMWYVSWESNPAREIAREKR
jgi:riboflavin transporter FmnP